MCSCSSKARPQCLHLVAKMFMVTGTGEDTQSLYCHTYATRATQHTWLHVSRDSSTVPTASKVCILSLIPRDTLTHNDIRALPLGHTTLRGVPPLSHPQLTLRTANKLSPSAFCCVRYWGPRWNSVKSLICPFCSEFPTTASLLRYRPHLWQQPSLKTESQKPLEIRTELYQQEAM